MIRIQVICAFRGGNRILNCAAARPKHTPPADAKFAYTHDNVRISAATTSICAGELNAIPGSPD